MKNISGFLFWCLCCFASVTSLKLFADKESVIFVLGDSLTEGLGVEKEQAFPFLLQTKIDQSSKWKGKYKIHASGIGGSTSASAPSRFRWQLKSKPFLLLLAVGANDGLRGIQVSELEKNITNTVELALKSNVKVLLAGMKMPPNYGKKYTKDYEDVYKKIASKFKIGFIPFLLEGVGGNSAMNQPDGIHPNVKGHQVIADHVWKYLEPML